MRHRLEGAWPRLRTLIIHGGTLCQVLLYPFIFIAGMYMIIAAPPNSVAEEMGTHVQYFWTWLSAVCPVLTLVAYLLRRSSFGDFALPISIGANAGLTLALGAYICAVVQASWIGRGLYATFLIVGVTLIIAAIAWRDVLRFIDSNRLTRSARGECP